MLRADIGSGIDIDTYLATPFDIGDFPAFFVIQVVGNPFVDFDGDSGDLLVIGGRHQRSHNLNRHAFGCFDLAGAGATGAILVDASLERWSDPLPGHLDQPEGTDPENLGPGPVSPNRFPERSFDLSAVTVVPHIDEIVDDDASQVPQSDLSADFLGCLHVDLKRGFLGIIVCPEVSAVDVDGDERFRLIDHDRATSLEGHVTVLNTLDFFLDFVFVENRFLAFVQFDAIDVSRHDDLDEFPAAFKGRWFIDPDGVDLAVVDIPNGANDHVAFFVNIHRARGFLDPADDGAP